MKRIILLFLLLLSAGEVFCQSPQITGIVKDKTSGMALPGVTVRVVNSGNGTQTDAYGKFALPTGGQKNVTLQFSYIGYAALTLNAVAGTPVTVQLELSASQINELVVVGYGEVKKTDLTGAVGSLDAGEITKRGTLSPMEALEGQVAGVSIKANSGRAGTS